MSTSTFYFILLLYNQSKKIITNTFLENLDSQIPIVTLERTLIIMRLEQLQYFTEIVKYGSMNIACKHLHVSQQNLSNAMIKFEEELGFSLFDRTPHGVLLTPQGEHILQSAKKILLEVAKIKEFADQKTLIDHTLSGNIKLNLSPYYTQKRFLNSISQVLVENPQLNIELYVNSSMAVLEQVNNNTDQIGLINLTEPQMTTIKDKFPHLQLKILNSDQLVVLANRESEIGNQKSVSINKLLNYKLLFYNDTPCQNEWMLDMFLSYGTPKSTIKCNNTEMAINSLKNNVSLVPVAKNASSNFLVDESIVMIPVRPRLDIFNILLINTQKDSTAAEKFFIDNLSDIIMA